MSHSEVVENNGVKEVDNQDEVEDTKVKKKKVDKLDDEKGCTLKETDGKKSRGKGDSGRSSSPRALWRYSKDDILKLRETPASRLWPICFSEDFKNEFGKWDPEAWHQTLDSAKRCASPVNVLERRREQLEDGIVLSPQRRSFGHGCQAPSMPQQIPERTKNGPVRNGERDFDGRSRLTGRVGRGKTLDFRERGLRTKESPDIKRIGGRDKEDDRYRDSRDLRDRDYNHRGERFNGRDKDFDRPRREIPPRKYPQQEEEPEWMTFGPTSQTDTIELVGFEGKLITKKNKAAKEKIKEEEAKETKSDVKRMKSTQEDESEEIKENVAPKQDQADKMFDINDLFKSENLLPPGFSEVLQDPSINEQQSGGSRFKQWFSHVDDSSHSNSSANSHSNSRRSSIVDEIVELAGLLQGSRSPSPVPNYMFAPITSSVDSGQSILEMLNKANINVQPLLDSVISQKREAEESGKQIKVKGRIRLEDLENSPRIKGETKLEDIEGQSEDNTQNSSAFLALVGDMKAKGRLPERPSPTIPGLPIHFLPCPPDPKEKGRRSPKDRPPSPLEMIEKAFARSQSPVNRPVSPMNGPLPTMNRSMSPLGMSPLERQTSPIPNRMNSPFGMLQSPIGSPQDVFVQGMLVPGHVSPPVDMLAQQLMLSDMSPMRVSPPLHRPSPISLNRGRNGPLNRKMPVPQFNQTGQLNTPTSRTELYRQTKTPSSSAKNSSSISTAFTPTAVLRKLHNDKQEQKQTKHEEENESKTLPGSPVLQQASKPQIAGNPEQKTSRLDHDEVVLSPQRQPLFQVPDVDSNKERTARSTSTPEISPYLPGAPPNTPQSPVTTTNSVSMPNTPNSINLFRLIQNKNGVNTPHSLPLPNSPCTPHSLPLPETPRPRKAANTRSTMETPHSLTLPETPVQFSLHNAHNTVPSTTPPNTPQNEQLRRASQKLDPHILLSPDSFLKHIEKNHRSGSPSHHPTPGYSKQNVPNSGHQSQDGSNPFSRSPAPTVMNVKPRPPQNQGVMHMHAQEQKRMQDQQIFGMQLNRHPMGAPLREPIRSVAPQQRRSPSPHFPQQFPVNRSPFPMHMVQRNPAMLGQMSPQIIQPGVMRYPPSQAGLHHLQNVAIQQAYAAHALRNRQQQMAQHVHSPGMYNMMQHQGMPPPQRPMMNVPLPMNQRFPSGMSQDNSLSKWFGEEILNSMPQQHPRIPSGATPGRRVISVEELERQHVA